MDRRAVFFLVAAAMSAALWPLAPPDKRWVNVWVCATYLVLALASLADFISRHRRTRGGGADPPSRASRPG